MEGRFCTQQMESYLKAAGITRQKTNPYTPEQNGLCERFNRTIVERAICRLFEAELDKSFWPRQSIRQYTSRIGRRLQV
jgi:transposase InsO family protein